jgi:hypothetical protein
VASRFSVHKTLLFVITNQVHVIIFFPLLIEQTQESFLFVPISTDLQSITPSCSALVGVRRKLEMHVKASKLCYKRIGQAIFSEQSKRNGSFCFVHSGDDEISVRGRCTDIVCRAY